jgi:hypothetical protein
MRMVSRECSEPSLQPYTRLFCYHDPSLNNNARHAGPLLSTLCRAIVRYGHLSFIAHCMPPALNS